MHLAFSSEREREREALNQKAQVHLEMDERGIKVPRGPRDLRLPTELQPLLGTRNTLVHFKKEKRAHESTIDLPH